MCYETKRVEKPTGLFDVKRVRFELDALMQGKSQSKCNSANFYAIRIWGLNDESHCNIMDQIAAKAPLPTTYLDCYQCSGVFFAV